MSANAPQRPFKTCGIHFIHLADQAQALEDEFRTYVQSYGLQDDLCVEHGPDYLGFSLSNAFQERYAPVWDTTRLYEKLHLQKTARDLEREILIAMLLATIPFSFPSLAELQSAIRIRLYVVDAGYRAALNFDTDAIERPEDCWHYDEEAGFLLNDGVPIIDALVKATQPQDAEHAYSFSCYRATEYVILLSIAREIQHTNPGLLKLLEERSAKRAIRSGEFHEVFLREYGSMEEPFPMKYYVPGDRVWFRNPDSISSDIPGYEGSWVIYLGRNLFTNFWKRDYPFSLETKCVEVYHWKDGVQRNTKGEPVMNESLVESCVKATLQDPQQYQTVLHRMMRYRDPKGVYGAGGCIDTSRESPRWVRPETTDIKIPT